MTRVSLLLALLVIVPISGCGSLFPPDLPDNPPVKEVRWLDQNWSAEERFWFHHASQGTSTLPVPYNWLLALERPNLSLFGDPGLLVDPEYMRQFGFIPSPRQDNASTPSTYAGQEDFYGNPDGLPVGFARTAGYVNPVTGEELPDQVGFTCAACHTGQLEFNGISIRVDGAPAMTDLGKFRKVLGLALAYTRYVPFRFGRFADRVLGEDHTEEQEAELKDQLKTLLEQGSGLLKITRATTEHDMEEGFTRLDALNRIGNQLFFTDLLDAKEPGFNALDNLVPISAPVNYPHIWDTSWFSWVQYDASIMQPMVRNAGEALGVSARINLVDPQRTLFKSSVPVRAVYQMEQLLAGENPFSGELGFKGLQSPKWPEDILGQIDAERKARGKALYEQHCQQCHLPPVTEAAFWQNEQNAFWTAPNAVGERYLKLKETPVDTIGTDPAQAKILAARQVKIPAFLGLQTDSNSQMSFGNALAAVVEKSVNIWYDENNIPPAEREDMNGNRPNKLQTKNIYKARPLNGIWATAPFLHNGSVPNLYALLSPAAERPTTFCLGSREFDPENVGYSTQCTKGTFQLDTTQPGNLNTGHEHTDAKGPGRIGKALSPDERRDLVEFLKSL